MSGAGFFDDDDDDEPSFVDRSTSSGAHDFFSDAASPRAYPRPAGGRVSSVSGGDRTSSSIRASSEAEPEAEPSFEAMTALEPAGPKERNVQLLIRCWSNEIAAPEVLPFPRDLVERVVKDLARRVRRISPASSSC